MKYKIITKRKKNYYSVNFYFYGTLVVSMFLMALSSNLNNDYFLLKIILTAPFLLIWIVGLFLMFYNSNKPKTLKGELEIDLELEFNYIAIGTEYYKLDEIIGLNIETTDHFGAYDTYKGNFDGILSNGVKNKFTVKLKSGFTVKLNFQQLVKHEIRRDKLNLINYCKAQKLSKLNLFDLLGINGYENIQKFKVEHSII